MTFGKVRTFSANDVAATKLLSYMVSQLLRNLQSSLHFSNRRPKALKQVSIFFIYKQDGGCYLFSDDDRKKNHKRSRL